MLFRADYQEFSLITFLDEIEEQRLLSSEKLRKDVATIELEMTILLEEVSRMKKSRALWLKEGDKNTKFFHRVANSNRKCNIVEILVINGDIFSNSEEVKDHIVQFFHSALYRDGRLVVRFGRSSFPLY